MMHGKIVLAPDCDVSAVIVVREFASAMQMVIDFRNRRHGDFHMGVSMVVVSIKHQDRPLIHWKYAPAVEIPSKIRNDTKVHFLLVSRQRTVFETQVLFTTKIPRA